MTRAMYHVENPEDYLTHRGSVIKPITPKSNEEKHKMNDEIIKHQIELENKQEDVKEEIQLRQWKSCCFQIDERIALFFSKLIISLLVLLFSFYQMFNNINNCSVSIGYSGFVSTIIGYWLSKA